METVVFYNAGKKAKIEGGNRIAPDTHEYPVVSKYVPFYTQTVCVKGTRMEQHWLDGYDSVR